MLQVSFRQNSQVKIIHLLLILWVDLCVCESYNKDVALQKKPKEKGGI